MEHKDNGNDKENNPWGEQPRTTFNRGMAARRMTALQEQLQAENLASMMEVDDEPEPFDGKLQDQPMDIDVERQTMWAIEKDLKLWSNFADGLDQSITYDFFVLDTCVYIKRYPELMYLWRYCENDSNNAIWIVPYQVFRELDGLKHGKEELNKVIAASKFIDSHIETSIHMKGQHKWDYELLKQKHNDDSGDDCIIECALQVQEEVPNGNVMMISEDRLMRLKCKAAKLNAMDMSCWYELYYHAVEVVDNHTNQQA